MNAEILFENFGLLTEELSSVQRLRELVLKMGMRGQLATQDDRDEPAAALLERIAGEGRLTSARSFMPVDTSDLPYEVPPTWEWVRLSQIVDYRFGRTPKTKVSTYWDEKGTPWVSIADMTHYGTITSTERGVSQIAQTEVFKYKPIPAGTLLMSFKLTIGKVSFLGVDAYHNEAIISIFPAFREFKSYLFYFLPLLAKQGELNNAIKGQTLNTDSLSNLLVPLPPLNEQHRIVAKVDQLMSLCDELEEKQTKRNEVCINLNTSVVDHLLAAKDSKEFDTHWQLIRTNFDLLYDKPKTVSKLRQAIIQLAVQGKLVPQDPKDESAGVLLEQIKTEKSQLIGKKEIKPSKPLPPISGDEVPYELPNGWEWAYIDECYEVVGGIQKTPKRNPINHFFPYLRVANVYRGRLDLCEIEYFELDEGEIDKWGLKEGDLLVVEGNGSENEIGRCAIWKGEIKDCVHQNHIIRCRPIGHQFGEFTLLFLNSLSGMDEMKRLAITTSGLYSLSVGKIRGIIFPIPPIDEQRRILSRLNELMGLCNKLEASLTRAHKVNEELLRVIIKRTVDA